MSSIDLNTLSTTASKAYLYWTLVGAVGGAIFAGGRKVWQISNEKSYTVQNEWIDPPLRCVYHTSRVAASTGWGGGVGGLAAATAPLAVPLYMLWLKRQEELKQKQQQQGSRSKSGQSGSNSN